MPSVSNCGFNASDNTLEWLLLGRIKTEPPLPIRRIRVAARYCALTATSLLAGAASVALSQPLDKPSAQSLLDSASSEIRIDPDAGRRQIESALQLLRRSPEPDVEIRAHLLLSRLLPGARPQHRAGTDRCGRCAAAAGRRPGLDAGVLTGRGQLAQMTGDNDQASGLYDQAAEWQGRYTTMTDAGRSAAVARIPARPARRLCGRAGRPEARTGLVRAAENHRSARPARSTASRSSTTAWEMRRKRSASYNARSRPSAQRV